MASVAQPSKAETVTKLVNQRFPRWRRIVSRRVRRWLANLQREPRVRHKLQLRYELLPLVVASMVQVAAPHEAEAVRDRLTDSVVRASHTRSAVQRATPAEKPALDLALAALMNAYHQVSCGVCQRLAATEATGAAPQGAANAAIDRARLIVLVHEFESFLAVLVAVVKWLAAVLSLESCIRALQSRQIAMYRNALVVGLSQLQSTDPETYGMLRERPEARYLTLQLLCVVAPAMLRRCRLAPRTYVPPEMPKRPGVGEVDLVFEEHA